jgi:tetratricopeptide (TPR) repeat protein
MSKKKDQNEEIIVDVEEVYSKTETFVEENKNVLTIVVAAIAIVIGGYFAYQSFYLKPLQVEAQESMFMAEKFFAMDSMNLAIYGNGAYPGFLEIADEYGATKAGNLAKYYLGIAYLRTGQYEAAIASLKDFSTDDVMVGNVAQGAIGDAYLELGDLKKAASSYVKAAERSENEFSSPLYLMRAASTYEMMNEYAKALEIYQEIKNEYSKSPEAAEVDKLIARAEAYVQ